MGTQRNRLSETVLFEHPKYLFKLLDKKIITILRLHCIFSFFLMDLWHMIPKFGKTIAGQTCKFTIFDFKTFQNSTPSFENSVDPDQEPHFFSSAQ